MASCTFPPAVIASSPRNASQLHRFRVDVDRAPVFRHWQLEEGMSAHVISSGGEEERRWSVHCAVQGQRNLPVSVLGRRVLQVISQGCIGLRRSPDVRMYRIRYCATMHDGTCPSLGVQVPLSARTVRCGVVVCPCLNSTQQHAAPQHGSTAATSVRRGRHRSPGEEG